MHAGIPVDFGEEVIHLKLDWLASDLVDQKVGFARGFEEDERRALDGLTRVVVQVQSATGKPVDERQSKNVLVRRADEGAEVGGEVCL
jgi:hypothetical protein